MSLFDLRVCLSPYRCGSLLLLSRVSCLTTHLTAGSRSFLICARVSHPDLLPAPTSFSCLGNCSSRRAPHLSTSSPSSLLDRTTFFSQTARPRPPKQASSPPTPCTDCTCTCTSSHRIVLHRITSNIHTPLSVPTLAHPPASGFQTLRPLVPLVPHDPINHRRRTLILPRCTTNRQTPCFAPCGRSQLLCLSARLRRRSRPWPPSRPVIFLSSSARHPPPAFTTSTPDRVTQSDSSWDRKRPFSSPVPPASLKRSFELQLWALLGHSLSILYLPGHKSWNTKHRAMSPVTDRSNDHTIDYSL